MTDKNISSKEKRTAFVVIFSAITMVLEIFFGVLTNSMALLADGIHMGSHVMAIGLSWAAYILVRQLNKRADNPYDSDRILSLSAFASGLLLLIFAFFIIGETIERVMQPAVEISAIDAMIVAVIGLIVNGICAVVLSDYHHHDGDINSHSAFLHVLADALTSIGAIFGLICAMIWNVTWVDTAVAFVLSLVIIRWAKGLLWQTAKSLTKKKHMKENNGTIETIISRTSIREYTDETISDADIEALLRTGMAAPSCCNIQPWHFVVVKEQDIRQQMADSIGPAQPAEKAPVVIVVCGDMHIMGESPVKDNQDYWVCDACAATENILLAAQGIGLGGVWMGVWPMKNRIKLLQTILHLPEYIIPLNMIAIGHPAEQPKPKDKWKPKRVHQNKW